MNMNEFLPYKLPLDLLFQTIDNLILGQTRDWNLFSNVTDTSLFTFVFNAYIGLYVSKHINFETTRTGWLLEETHSCT